MKKIVLSAALLSAMSGAALADSNLGVDGSLYEPIAQQAQNGNQIVSPLKAIASTFDGFDAVAATVEADGNNSVNAPLGPR